MNKDSVVTRELSFAGLRHANVARQSEWDAGGKLTLAYRGNEFAGEAGEVCNVIKKLERERLGIRGSRDTVEHLAEELADAVMTADLIASHVGIDLAAAIVAKFNTTSEANGISVRLTAAQQLPQDVIDLVIAARLVAFGDNSSDAFKALDQASEAFASRVRWDDEPDDCSQLSASHQRS